MASPADLDPVATFFSNWATYRAVIDHDCMEHREIYAAVGDILAERSEPFTVLDLGCGDAAGVSSAITETAISRYTGVDNAGPALEFAAQTLGNPGFEVELLEQDLALAVGHNRTYDVVIMAFALHHFSSAEKQRILADIQSSLRPGGELLLIDVVRRDGQSREDYLAAYTEYVRTWPLSDETVEAIIAHVHGFDFPEEADTQPRWAIELGYSSVEQFYSGGNGTQRAWRLHK